MFEELCVRSSHLSCVPVLQVFLAMPSACPVAPDGSKRTVPTGADDRGAVTMYTSDDNAETFKQVSNAYAKDSAYASSIQSHHSTSALSLIACCSCRQALTLENIVFCESRVLCRHDAALSTTRLQDAVAVYPCL